MSVNAKEKRTIRTPYQSGCSINQCGLSSILIGYGRINISIFIKDKDKGKEKEKKSKLCYSLHSFISNATNNCKYTDGGENETHDANKLS